jgi:hypothetical protein
MSVAPLRRAGVVHYRTRRSERERDVETSRVPRTTREVQHGEREGVEVRRPDGP